MLTDATWFSLMVVDGDMCYWCVCWCSIVCVFVWLCLIVIDLNSSCLIWFDVSWCCGVFIDVWLQIVCIWCCSCLLVVGVDQYCLVLLVCVWCWRCVSFVFNVDWCWLLLFELVEVCVMGWLLIEFDCFWSIVFDSASCCLRLSDVVWCRSMLVVDACMCVGVELI